MFQWEIRNGDNQTIEVWKHNTVPYARAKDEIHKIVAFAERLIPYFYGLFDGVHYVITFGQAGSGKEYFTGDHDEDEAPDPEWELRAIVVTFGSGGPRFAVPEIMAKAQIAMSEATDSNVRIKYIEDTE